MKKIIALFSAVFVTVSVQAQTINFRIDYKPNTTYTSTTTQTQKLEMNYGEEPVVQESQSKMTGTFKTGSLSNGLLPYNMELTVEEGQAAQLSGTKISGTIKPGQMPSIETVVTPGNDPMVNDMLKVMLKEMFKQSWFEPRQVKTGETFIIEIPMEVPLGPVNMRLKDVGTYKLERVEGTRAYLTQNHVITLDMDIEGQNMKGSGTGSGTLVFDTANNFIIKNDADMVMEMGFEAQGTPMQVKTDLKMAIDVTITPTK